MPLVQPLNLRNTFVRLTVIKKLKVVVIGNSVTNGAPIGQKQNPSFYVALEQWLRRKFPEAEIKVVPKIIFAMGPEVQLFRMDDRVISEQPGLVLAEFNAANGAAHGQLGAESPWRAVTEPATEGFVRRLRSLLPSTDLILELAIFKTMLEDYRHGRVPVSSSFQHTVAERYGLVCADAGAEIARLLLAGEPWEAYMDDGIHPGARGYEVYSRVLVEELERQWALFQSLPLDARVLEDYMLPSATVHPSPWAGVRYVPAAEAGGLSGFRTVAAGVTFIAGEVAGSSGVCEVPGARLVGLLLHYEEPCGNLEVRSPGGDWIRLSLLRDPKFTYGEDARHRYCRLMFGVHGLPLGLASCPFRISAAPETAGAYRVGIAGFFAVENAAWKESESLVERE